MSTLRVIVDEIVDPAAGGVARYAEELTRQLIATRPRGSDVSGIVSSSPEVDYRTLEERLPGLSELHKSALTRRQLAAAWQHGFTPLPGTGIVHATSLLAPLRNHDRRTDPSTQIAVTIHDAIAWTDPELIPSRMAAWSRAMGKRAERYADAIVVPSHAVAADLAEHLDLGTRVRVIGGAPSSQVHAGPDAADRRRGLGLPDRYLLAVAGWEPRKGLEPLLRALGDLPDERLVLVGASDDRAAVLDAAGWAAERVTVLDRLSDDDLGAVYEGATLYVQPSLAEGFGLAMIEAFAFGLPVIHSDVPALVEVAADAGVVVERDDPDGYSGRLSAAIRSVLEDGGLAERLGLAARDRAGAFSWRDAAEKIWQLHADL